MKVALVNPPFSKLVYGEEYSIKSITPCLGLFYLEAYCRDIAEFKIFEGEFYSDMNHLSAAINAYAPDVLGITTNTSTYPLCVELAGMIDARCKFVGGPYASFRVDECLRDFDMVFIGDAEIGLRDFLSGKSLDQVSGIAYRDETGEIHRTAAAMVLDLDSIPFPNHAAMQIGLYQASPHREMQNPFATMITTRGCGFLCTFCLSSNTGMNEGKYRERSVSNVIAEIQILTQQFGVKSIQFWDDTFTMRKERTRELCRELSRFGISYVCNTRTDKMDDEIAEMLAASGCKAVFFGIESGDQYILNSNISKGVRNEQVIRAIDSCQKFNIQTTASFIFGSLDDTLSSIEETISFSLKLNTDFVLYNIYTAHPGTSGYYSAIQQKVIDEYSVDIQKWRGEPVGIPTICKNLSRADLHILKCEAYIRYYTSKNPSLYKSIINTYENTIKQFRISNTNLA